MMSFFSRMRNRSASDRGDAALIMGLFSVIFFLIIFSVTSSLVKDMNVTNAFTSMAQNSAEKAVKTINSAGSLDEDSVTALLTEYRAQSNSAANAANETGSYKTTQCQTAEINGVSRKLPYYVITLSKTRDSVEAGDSANTLRNPDSWTVRVEGNGAQIQDMMRNPTSKYKVISATIYDGSTNFLSNFGIVPCFVRSSQVSAIAFGSNSDLG